MESDDDDDDSIFNTNLQYSFAHYMIEFSFMRNVVALEVFNAIQ